MREKNSWKFYLCISHRCLTKDGHRSSPMSLNSQLMEELQGSQLNDNNILNFPLLTQVNVFTSRRLTHPRAAWEEGEKCPWTEDFESLGGPATRSVNTGHISPVTEDVGGRGRLLMPRSVHVTLIHWGWSGTPHEQSQSNWNLLEVSKFHWFLAPGPRPGDIGEGLTRWEVSLDFPCGPVGKNPPVSAGDMVWFLVWDDSTCREATNPVLCNKGSHS